MIFDLSREAPRELPEYDLCIVGSGPAGGTLAAELAGSGLRLCVLESGRQRPTRHGEQLKAVEWEGLPIKDYSRERCLGGASRTWAGLSAPLDAIDLAPRPWIGGAGWPLPRAELEQAWAQAGERYLFPTAEQFRGFGALRGRGDALPAFEGFDEKVFLARAEPQRWSKLVRSCYEGRGVDLYLDASVAELEADAERGRVRAARVMTSGGQTLRLRAAHFALCCGGIENARLLLLSRGLGEAGLGNGRDQVGRCLMNHPKNYRGMLELTRPVRSWPYLFGCLFEGFAGYAGLRLSEDRQRELEVLNSYVRFEPLFPWSDDQGVESAVLLAKRSVVALRALQRRQRGQVVELRDYSETGDDSELQNARKGWREWLAVGGNVVRHAPSVARYGYHRLSRRAPLVRRVRLRNFMEMEPSPQNRVQLGEGRDAHGQPLPRVRHTPTALDRRSLIALHGALAAEFTRTGLGRLDSDLAEVREWPITQDASHHLGTTRLGSDPAHSVTDPDLTVHGVPNLSVAGGSVFPTSGCANPTFTIVALSIRLAAHLRRRLAVREELPRP
jgi:choline dehydrogenase-like flavoprotein